MTHGDGPFRTAAPRPIVPRPSIGALRSRHPARLGARTVGSRRAWLGNIKAATAALLEPGRGVDVHEDGIAIRMPGQPSREIHFDEIDLLFASVGRIVITTHEGERIVLPAPHPSGALLDVLVARCSIPLVPTLREGLLEGGSLRFGQLTIDRKGATVGDLHLDWSDIARVTLDDERLTFHGHDDRVWCWLGVATLPHVRALARVLGDMTRLQIQ